MLYASLVVPALIALALGCLTGLLHARRAPRAGRPWKPEYTSLGVPIRLANVIVFPLYGRHEAGWCDRVDSLDRGKRVRVEERDPTSRQLIGATSIAVHNRGPRPVLMPGGLVLRGGAQDRQLAEELVIEPGERREVAAYCVERGRSERPWYRSGSFVSTRMLAPVHVRNAALARRDQHLVWSAVEWVNDHLGCTPETKTLLAALRCRRLARGRNAGARQLRAKLRRDPWRRQLVGFAYAYPGRVVGARFFASNRLFRKFEAELLATIANDAALAAAEAEERPCAVELADYEQMRAFLLSVLAELRQRGDAEPTDAQLRAIERAEGRIRGVVTGADELVSVHCDPGPLRLAS